MMLSPLEELCDRANAEFAQYCAKLLDQSPEKISENSFTTALKQDFLFALENDDWNESIVKALLQEKQPLEALCQWWDKSEAPYMEIVRGTIEGLAQQNQQVRNMASIYAQSPKLDRSR